jgi:hypothetical protein
VRVYPPKLDRLALIASEVASGRHTEAPLPLLALAYLDGCSENVALKRLSARCPAHGIRFEVEERTVGSVTTRMVVFKAPED